MKVKLPLWRNDKREKSTQPILKAGKPVEIDGQQYWVSAWINAPQNDTQLPSRIDAFVDALAQANGTYPIINISLEPAEARRGDSGSYGQPAMASDDPHDEIPF